MSMIVANVLWLWITSTVSESLGGQYEEKLFVAGRWGLPATLVLHPHLTLDKLKLGSKVLIRNLTYFTSKFYALISMEHVCIMAVLLHVCLWSSPAFKEKVNFPDNLGGGHFKLLKSCKWLEQTFFFNFLDTAGGRDRGQNEFMAVADSNFTIIADIKIGKQTSVINWVYK